MKKINSKYTTVLLHAGIWSLLFALPHVFIDSKNMRPGTFPGSFYNITNLYNIGIFYFNAFVLYPLFFNKRRWWAFILSVVLVVIASYYLKLFITKEWYPSVVLDKWAYRILFFPAIPFLIISTIYRLVVGRIAFERKQKEIQAEQLSMKLKFLRSQISPHFIFNVLTNLVSLARKKSELLEPLLIKLSELMRYILYESDEKKVTLYKEVEYLNSYIELQTLRFGHDVKINSAFDIPETELQNHIEPMLLIPFVENAFKHGMGMEQPQIDIRLFCRSRTLEFDVKNKFSNEDKSKDDNPGIGLENVQSRLQLLYPDTHRLIIKKENNLFYIHLILQLK